MAGTATSPQADDEPAAHVVAANLCGPLVDVRVDGTAVEGDLAAAVGALDRPERALDPDDARGNGRAAADDERASDKMENAGRLDRSSALFDALRQLQRAYR